MSGSDGQQTEDQRTREEKIDEIAAAINAEMALRDLSKGDLRAGIRLELNEGFSEDGFDHRELRIIYKRVLGHE